MAWDKVGNTYISDGYINSRIAKVNKNGNWIKSWGEPGNQPGQFSTPHSLAVDAEDHVYVADRGNGRIQVLDGEEGSFGKSQLMCHLIRTPALPLGASRSYPSKDLRQWRRLTMGNLHHASAELGFV